MLILPAKPDPNRPLPPIRQDLAIHKAPDAPDGSPCWHLHDPAANQFYQLGWVAFEVLSRWALGTASAVVDAVCDETTLDIDDDTISSMLIFLERHNLLLARSAKDSERLLAANKAAKHHWTIWLLHNYLFFRIPLVRPDAWLQKWAPRIWPALDRRFWVAVLALALVALALVARQWDNFLHGFSDYTGTEKLIAFAIAVSLAKVGHELGHALVARYHGCKVPTMGVAFLVMWPVLYTDTNEAWKLPSNKARFQIAIAGMATEICIAIVATWAWLWLPDGPTRSAALFMATTSWLMTLALNASPFMRFDGYFLLVDAMGLPNLHQRSFALGRWWLREKLFHFGDPVPEQFPERRQKFLIAFAFGVWVYRFTLFVSIAVLVYLAFFKLLGVLLFLVEVGWFLIRPLWMELEVWWQRRHAMTWNPATRRTAIAASILVMLLILPWRIEISAPAVQAADQEHNFYAPFSARVLNYPAERKSQVSKDEVLLELDSPEGAHRLRLAQIAENTMRRKLEQQVIGESLVEQGDVIKRQWEEAAYQVQGLEEQNQRLVLRAPFDGKIVLRADDLLPGAWVTERERLLVVANPAGTSIEVFVSEKDIDRLHLGDLARFVPDGIEHGRKHCHITEIDRVYIASVDEHGLSSTYGGLIATRPDKNGQHVPVAPTFRVRLGQCSPAAAATQRLTGVAHLEADGRSIVGDTLRQVMAVIIRESGF